MPLTKRLEMCGGLFLDLAFALFFGGGRSRSRELSEDNSSSTTALLSSGCSLVRFHPDLFPDEPTGDRFLVVDGQHGFTIQPYFWLVLLVSSPYPDASEGIGLQGIDLMGCWP